MRLPRTLDLAKLVTTWASIIDPVLSFEPNNGVLLTNIAIKTGVNQISHKLGRRQLGWIITDINANSSLHRSQPFNDLTLTLTATADCTVSLWCY